MNYIFIIVVSLFFCCERNEYPYHKEEITNQSSEIVSTKTSIHVLTELCLRFNELNTRIRDGQINSQAAQDSIRILAREIENNYDQKISVRSSEEKWVFPVSGYTSRAIGGTNGNGYIANGYNYFDGNKHGGHPAHDIFINDKNQDCIDDKTKKYIQALSMTSGIDTLNTNINLGNFFNFGTTLGDAGGWANNTVAMPIFEGEGFSPIFVINRATGLKTGNVAWLPFDFSIYVEEFI